MRFCITLFFILTTTLSFSQQGKGFSLGLNFSANYDDFRFVGKSKEYFSDVKDFTNPYWGYSYGLTLKYMFNNRLGLETGALLTKKGMNIDNSQYSEDYFSTEIPLKISYKIINAKLSCSINTGTNLSFTNRFKGGIKHSGNDLYEKGVLNFIGVRIIEADKDIVIQTQMTFTPNSRKGYRNFNLIPNASIALTYQLTDKFSAAIEPIFRFSLFNQSSKKYESYTYTKDPIKFERNDPDTSQIFWNYGLNTTIYYSF